MSVTLQGFADLQEKLKNFPVTIQKEVSQEIQASALTIVRNAQSRAPYDTGLLARRISTFQSGELQATIVSPTNYSAYQEFGVGSGMNIPSGFEEVAEPAKGLGIRHFDMEAQPFLIPSFQEEIPALLARIQNILNDSLTP